MLTNTNSYKYFTFILCSNGVFTLAERDTETETDKIELHSNV